VSDHFSPKPEMPATLTPVAESPGIDQLGKCQGLVRDSPELWNFIGRFYHTLRHWSLWYVV